MAITLMNAAQEIEAYNAPDPPDRARDAEGRFIAIEEKPKTEESAPEAKEEAPDADAEPEWYERHHASPELRRDVENIIKRAINKKHAQAKEAEEFAAEQYNEKMLAERRAEEYAAEVERLKAAPPKPVDEVKRPERSAFANDEAYIEAVADWKTEQKFKVRDEQAAKDREEARQQAIKDAASARIDAARTVIPDYDEVVAAADVLVPFHIAAYLQESELLAEFGYHFAKHPEEMRKLAAMPAKSMADLQRIGVALSKIEGNLTSFGSQPKAMNGAKPSVDADTDGDLPSDTGFIPSPKPRAAAPVIQPLSSGSGNQVEKREEAKSYDEARASWEKRNRRNFDVRKRH